MNALREIEQCPACQSSDRTVRYRATTSLADESALDRPYSAHYQINQCVQCGLLRSSPIFDRGSVGHLYSDAGQTNTSVEEVDNVRRTMAGYYGLLRKHLASRQRFLDIGCDRGLLLQTALADGFKDVYGIEPNPTARREAAALPGVHLSAQFYEDSDYPPNYFDAITLIHVLDHLIDPGLALRRARQHLRPNGVILAVVHDVESILVRVCGQRFPIFNLYHHYFFSAATLCRLFEHIGYQTLFVGSTKNCYSLGYLASKVPGLPGVLTRSIGRALTATRLGSMPIMVPLGNIGIVARRPA